MITVCVPLYNRGADITRLLRNLNGQPNVCVTIADYHSDDINLDELISTMDLKIHVVRCNGVFNIANATQSAIEESEESVILIVDADTIFSHVIETFDEIRKQVIKGETYYCPNVGTYAKPTKWRAEWNGNCWVPTYDPRGFGILAVHKSDYMQSGGFINSEYTKSKGEFWGGHDGFLMEKLHFLKKIRPTLGDVWLGENNRDSKQKWYSKNGGKEWYHKK